MRALDGKVAIVTGATTGIGRGIAVALARAGAKIVVGDIIRLPREGSYDERPDLTTAELIAEIGGSATFAECDVTQSTALSGAVDAAVSLFGRLDIMVNNAGIFTRLETIIEQSEEDYELTMAVNAKSVWLGCKFALRQMMRQEPLPGRSRGRVINIASAAGVSGLPLEPAYCASKGAVLALTRQLAVDFGPHGIGVNAIMPGPIKTVMTRSALEDPETAARFRQATPFSRLGTAGDIAAAAAFLAGDEAEFINGAAIAIDGGATAR
ncbi:SDR family oxidoreductase [Xanthomonas vasicola]|uniref:Short-chain dehydrogenase n=1 Tax=Xanthomonas vasicola pv. vasculorum NCPPB 890 TaxID=1184265 RepID=A0A836ZTF9_XANVA|nr:SDR family oxidoreductase [Xanthomonas vasicola]KFA23462.1 short-chain dehydrogenase [Xanthomonas vasicola pv. vasculorum NCPPB 1326]KFA26616.1 short-chain dehydrogenase [Xanthomonas vasicola pv. vasculorum NCPPB 1381]KFA37850.1 short-chain dehydrogenase [Xanthomonas vasicola pv. vasculorum NCPPB 206]MBV6744853.1 SDR family oxidoreductase [Xanthomonas vasicola pv. vasculorum NCPPB 890]MBV6890432.1 SDR family oxidoreductase [Xanthomonas vasicola pv. vasculorum]